MIPADSGAYSSLFPEKAYDLDIRDEKAKTKEQLFNYIEDAVKGTQSFFVHAYPNRLVMTSKQYDLLDGSPQFMNIGEVGQTYWLYRTKYNVMEILVKDK
jgi:hypothetical protein